jgi:hypothetical protein
MLLLWGLCLILTVAIYASVVIGMRSTVTMALSYILMLTFGITALFTLLHV